MKKYDRYVRELQILTGVVTDDIEYLMYKVIKCNEEDVAKNKEEEHIPVTLGGYYKEDQLDDWFDKI